MAYTERGYAKQARTQTAYRDVALADRYPQQGAHPLKSAVVGDLLRPAVAPQKPYTNGTSRNGAAPNGTSKNDTHAKGAAETNIMTVSPPAPNVSDLLAPTQGGLQQVEALMKTTDDVYPPLADAVLTLVGSGGKRLRPALALLCAGLAGVDESAAAYGRVIASAASVEMLHTATLVHDDVVDEANLRRGRPTLNASWSSGSTVLAGNFMVARAAEFSAQTENMDVINVFSKTLEVLVNGELDQIFARHNYEQKKADYYSRIFAKTGSLYTAATESAAILAGLSAEGVQQLTDFGYYFGMAFQIMDDILDFTGTEKSLGKPAGGDLRQGTLTLPFFHHLQAQADPSAVIAQLEEAQLAADDDDERGWHALVDTLVQEVRTGAGVATARQEAVDFLHRAKASIAPFANGPHKRSLLGLCDFVVQRTY